MHSYKSEKMAKYEKKTLYWYKIKIFVILIMFLTIIQKDDIS